MQDIHSIGGGGARLFSGGGGGVAADRRLRPQHHHHHHQGHQALKCPRCDSLNTKFCYYNNYNLSQPRHFCKSCRRYWTKGGVLRNVPVGGGCRKTKRSKPKQNTSSTITDSTASITTPQQQNRPPPENNQNKSSNSHSHSHSSSESSSLTATNNTAANTGVEAASAHSASSVSNNLLNGMVESKLFAHGNMNPSFETALLEQGSDCGIFSEIGSFTSLITSTNDLSFGFNNIVNQQQQQGVEHGQTNYQNQQQWQTMQQQQQGMAGGLIDQTVQVELSGVQNNRGSNGGGFGALDWQGTGDQGGGLFDLPNAVDHAYWSQNQWNDQDHPSLYLP